MVLKQSFGYRIGKLGHMVLKESNGYTGQKTGHMVLKGVNWVHNTKIMSYDIERSQLNMQ